MAILKEYLCRAHGRFESRAKAPRCPRGCDTVQRAFYTAPGALSERSRGIDQNLQRIAADYGFTDMRNSYHGDMTSVGHEQARDAQARLNKGAPAGLDLTPRFAPLVDTGKHTERGTPVHDVNASLAAIRSVDGSAFDAPLPKPGVIVHAVDNTPLPP